MSTTTAYGYKIMAEGDPALTWMDDTEDNWNRMSSHDHDGSDSSLLTPNAVTKYSSTISGASWGSDLGGGTYKQTITVPSGVLEINDFDLMTYITSTGERVYPRIVRASATTYDIYSNDNSVAFTVKYN